MARKQRNKPAIEQPEKEAVAVHELPRRELIVTAATLFIIALVLKLGFLYIVRDNPFIADLTNDETHHFETAESIMATGVVRDDAFYFAPLYPYLLAGIFSLAGKHVLLVKVLHALAGSVNVVMLWLLVLTIFRHRYMALLAAGMAMLYGGYYFFEVLLLKTTFAVLLTTAMMLLIALGLRGRRYVWLWLVAGVVCGVTCLLRGNTLLVVPVIVFALVYEWRRQVVSIWSPVLFVVGLAVAISPATIHNAYVTGDFVLTTYQGGSNFYIGNNEDADGTYKPLRPRRQIPAMEKEDAISLAETEAGRKLSPSEISGYWFGRSMAYIADRPMSWLKLTVMKVWLFHANNEPGDTIEYSAFREHERVLYAAFLPYGVIVSLAAVGFGLTVRTWREHLIWQLLLIAFSASVFMFFIFSRYRTPVVGLYIVFASNAIWRMIDWVMLRKWSQFIVVLAIVLSLFMLLAADFVQMRPAASYNNLGAKYIEQGDYERAILEFTTALEMAPYNLNYRHNYARALEKLGRYEDASEQWRQVLDGLAGQLDKRGEDAALYEELRETCDRYIGALEQLGDRADTIAELSGRKKRYADRLIELYGNQPSLSERDFKLGVLLTDAGRYDQALDYLLEAKASDPGNPRVFVKLGLCYVGLGRLGEAEAAFRKAVELDGADAAAYQFLGNVYYLTDRAGEALESWGRAIELKPDNRALREQYERLSSEQRNSNR